MHHTSDTSEDLIDCMHFHVSASVQQEETHAEHFYTHAPLVMHRTLAVAGAISA